MEINLPDTVSIDVLMLFKPDDLAYVIKKLNGNPPEVKTSNQKEKKIAYIKVILELHKNPIKPIEYPPPKYLMVGNAAPWIKKDTKDPKDLVIKILKSKLRQDSVKGLGFVIGKTGTLLNSKNIKELNDAALLRRAKDPRYTTHGYRWISPICQVDKQFSNKPEECEALALLLEQTLQTFAKNSPFKNIYGLGLEVGSFHGGPTETYPDDYEALVYVIFAPK